MKGLLLLLYLTRLTIATLNCEGSNADVQLCSTPQNLSQVAFVCPGQLLTFMCRTVGSLLLEWRSSQYVSDTGSPLFFSSQDTVGTLTPSPNGASIANLTKLNNINTAMITLESQLYFNVLDQYRTSQIICINTANNVNATINFNVDLEGTSTECRSSATVTTPVTPLLNVTTRTPVNPVLNTTTLEPPNEAPQPNILRIVLPSVIGGIILSILAVVCIGIIAYCCCCREEK